MAAARDAEEEYLTSAGSSRPTGSSSPSSHYFRLRSLTTTMASVSSFNALYYRVAHALLLYYCLWTLL